MKVKLWAGVLLAVSLILSSIGVAFAQDGQEGTRRGFVGTVSSYEGTTLVIEGRDDDTATSTPITITGVTEDKVKYHGQPAVTEVAGTLEPGAKVVVLAQLTEDGDWEAIQVVVKPVEPTAPPVIGAVASIDENGVLTITRRDGSTKTVQLGRGAVPPEVGELVTAFAGRPSVDGEEDGDGPPVATGLVRAAEVRQRLNFHLQQAADDPELPVQTRARLVVHLATTLDSFSGQHINVLEAVRTKAPAAAQHGIDTALANAQRGREQAQANAEEARAKAGPPADRGRPEGAGNEEEEEESQGDQGQGGQGGQGGGS